MDTLGDLEETSADVKCDADLAKFFTCVDEHLECDDTVSSYDRCDEDEQRLENCLNEEVDFYKWLYSAGEGSGGGVASSGSGGGSNTGGGSASSGI